MDISYAGVFLEGLLSFISPCILPLVPLYMSYLTSDAKYSIEGEVHYKNTRIILKTIFFILGISTTYFLLGISVNLLRGVISEYRDLIMISGGIILIVFALHQSGIIKFSFLDKEKRLYLEEVKALNYFKAYLLGFVFSFAWTPCIGPLLANVLLLASTSNALKGNLLILLYTLGFTIPFILLGLFYAKAISFIKAKRDLLLKISKLSAIILIAFGVYLLYDGTKNLVSKSNESAESVSISEISLKDQYGFAHKLSDYEGDYIMLNFVASWCTYCKQEVTDFERFAKDEDIVAMYVMSETINSLNGGGSIDDFIAETKATLPILNDEDDKIYNYVGVTSFPTMLYIGPDGSIIGYQNGAMDYDMFDYVFKLAKERYESKGEE